MPPQIAKNQYDVPLPTVDVLLPQGSRTTERLRAAYCHIALCRLTEILGELLPLVYGLQLRQSRETSKKVRQIRTDLDMWEDSLPELLRSPANGSENRIAGTSSLQLAFLSLKMLVSRVELNEVNNAEADNPEARRYFQTECRRSAEDIVQFISSLQRDNFKEFWLPCKKSPSKLLVTTQPFSNNPIFADSAFHLTSTATLLVRCALETTDTEIARSCLANVETLRTILRRVREDEDWDLADMCLDHCERILNRLPQAWNSSSLANGNANGGSNNGPRLVNPAAISLPETQTNNDIVDDMMSISGTFGTMDGFPFDMTGIWDMSVFQDVNLP